MMRYLNLTVFFLNLIISNPTEGQGLVSITPNCATAGQTLNVTITGTNTNFSQGSSSILNFDIPTYFTQGTPVNSINYFNVINDTNLTANITVPSNAVTGYSHLSFWQYIWNNGWESHNYKLNDEFYVENLQEPKIVDINPNIANPGQTLNVTITGTNTNFSQGSSSILNFDIPTYFTQGTPVNSINYFNVINDTNLTANITVPSNAVTGYSDLSFWQYIWNNGWESHNYKLNDEFYVGGKISSVTPQIIGANQTISVSIDIINTSLSNNLSIWLSNDSLGCFEEIFSNSINIIGNQAIATFSIPSNATNGWWDIKIANQNDGLIIGKRMIKIGQLCPPNLSYTGGLSFICGGSVLLNAGAGYSNYYWNTGDTTQSITVYESGDYYAFTIGNFGCSAYSDTLSVNVSNADFSIAFTVNSNLFTAPPFAVQFDNTTPNPSNYNFTWDFGDGNVTATNNLLIFHEYLFNGTYDITLFAEEISTGCTDTLFMDDYIYCTGGTGCTHSATLAQTGPVSGCDGDTILLSCNSSPTFSYQWKLNGISIPGATNDTLYATQSGNYMVMIIENGCPVYSQGIDISLTPFTLPTITATGSITPCSNDSMTLSAPAGYTSYLWSTGATTQNITVYNSGNYTVTVTDNTGCVATASPYVVNTSFIQPPDLCMVGVDSASGNNIVIWEKPNNTAIDSFYIYKESNVQGVYDLLAAQSYSAFSIYLDVTSNPMQQADKYQIAIVDSCGNYTAPSGEHKTIHLTINAGMGGTWNLIWNHYEGFTYGTYNIYRGTSQSNMTMINSVSSSNGSYTDLTPPTGLVYYQIEVVKSSPCNPSKMSYESSRSNIAETGQGTGLSQQPQTKLTLYPNPTTGILTIKGAEGIASVYDIYGRLVLTSNSNMLDISNAAMGIYFVRVVDDQGKVYVGKVVKE